MVVNTKLIARNERHEVEARKEFYNRLRVDELLLKIGQYTGKKGEIFRLMEDEV